MRIVLVGAGPGGAATALLLARAGTGAEVVLLERERDLERAFRGEGLMPAGLDALRQMGLGPALAELPGGPIEAWQIHLDRREILSIPEPAAELGPLAPRVVSQPALLGRMLAEASRQPGFALRMGTGVRGLLREGERVTGVRVATDAGEEAIGADLVVGCDGRASTVRRRAGLELALLPESYDVLWLKAPCPPQLAGRSPIQIFASGPEAALAYVSWDGRWQIAWMLDKGSWRELRRRDWLAELLALFPEPLAAHLRAARAELEGPALLDVVVGRCPAWTVPGLLLLGDAAHPMSPIRAQGINVALRDALVAANHLVPALRRAGNLDAACRAVQGEREPEVARLQKLQLRESRGQRWARERPWLMAPLLRLAPLLARTGLIQRSWLRQQRELRFGTREVRLVV